MAHDRGEWLRGAATEEPEIPARDLPAVDVVDAGDAEQHPLDRSEPGVIHPVAEQAPDMRKQVEVPGDLGRRPT